MISTQSRSRLQQLSISSRQVAAGTPEAISPEATILQVTQFHIRQRNILTNKMNSSEQL
jgi:hypothetical protein